MSLQAFLADINPSIVAYLTRELLLESVSDFANFWTAAEYERGVQEDVVARVYANPSVPVAKVQVARLRAAWLAAHGQAPAMAAKSAVAPPMSAPRPEPVEAPGTLELPTVTIKKGSEVLAGPTSFVTVAEADNGKLYCAPFSCDGVLVIDPATGGSQKLGNLGAVAHKYATMVKHSSGKFYSPPFSAERALELDPAAGTAREIGGSLGTGHAKWECIVEADNGQLYCAPGNSHRVLKIDPAAGSAEEFGQPIGDLGGGPSGHYTSIKKAGNGKLYSAPLNATRVLMIDPARGSVQEIGEKLGVGGGSCTPGVPGKGGPDSDKWWAMAPGENGKLYCPPCNGLRVLVIDPSTDTVYKIGPYFAGDSKWGGVARAPNGRLYSPPRDAERVLMIDPKTDTVREIGKSFGEGGDKWSSIVLARDGRFYCMPRGARAVLRIDPLTDTAEELPGLVGEGGRWQWMGSVASRDGSVYAPPCMADRVLCVAPKAAPNPRRVLVTGAGGKTGSLALAKMARCGELAAMGAARTEASAANVRAATGAGCVVCDARDPKSVDAALASVETLVILHSATPKMAGKGPTGAPIFAYPVGGEPEKVDWEGGKVLIDSAKRAGVQHVVFVSSMGGTQPEHFLNKIKTAAADSKAATDGNIILWKRKAEMYLLDSGLPYTIIHPGGLLPHFGDEVVPDGQRQLEVGLDDALTKLPPTSRTIPRGDVAELVLQCVLNREAAVGRSFDVISHEPNPAKAWDKNLKTLLATLGGGNTDYSKPEHPILRG